MLRKRVLVVSFMLLLGVMQDVFACGDSAVTELEKLYCQVKAKGEGAGLPRFDDFRRNPPQTQQLLLKRPVKRAGLVMPKMVGSKVIAPKIATNKPNNARSSVPINTQVLASIKHCNLEVTGIQCGQIRYGLLDNQANKKLVGNALGTENQLQLPPVPDYTSNLELHHYLQRAYAQYLHKMQMIGLAGATLSYSKFYYIFDEVSQQQQDFVQRFADMYTYLKKDKSTIAVVRAHKNKPLPKLASCEPIEGQGLHFIVCDKKGANWVYQLD